MGANSDGGYMAMDINGENSLVQYNSIENTGYVGIKFDGNNTVVSNNFLNRFNLVKNDGGGIYTYAGTGNRKHRTESYRQYNIKWCWIRRWFA